MASRNKQIASKNSLFNTKLLSIRSISDVFQTKEEKLFGNKSFLEIILGIIKRTQSDVLTNIKSNLQKIRLKEVSKPSSSYKNKTISTESNIIKYSKNANNNINNNKALILKKDKMICFPNNFSNNLLKNSNKSPSHDDNINKDKKEPLSSTKRKRPLSIMNSCQTRPINKFKIKKKYNIFDDEIFINKDTIKTLNYCRDENIIDKPLIINQTDFRVDNVKGSLENKILELEYFTKRKLDELVKEIKNFIPIHFNAYLRE